MKLSDFGSNLEQRWLWLLIKRNRFLNDQTISHINVFAELKCQLRLECLLYVRQLLKQNLPNDLCVDPLCFVIIYAYLTTETYLPFIDLNTCLLCEFHNLILLFRHLFPVHLFTLNWFKFNGIVRQGAPLHLVNLRARSKARTSN
jgi:hypothetical protein